jgi:parallel beta-helix repeat protein
MEWQCRGDSIEVWNSTYVENVVVNKGLTIYSRDGADATIVDGGDSDSCFEADWTDWVNITGFTITNADVSGAGIYLDHANHCNISGNNGSYNDDYGIRVWGNYNTITANTVEHNRGHGIQIYYGNYNIVTGNTLINNDGTSKSGVYLTQSNYNTITDNTASYNYYGIGLYASTGNDVSGNTVRDNSEYGFRLYDADDNTITCNWVTENGVAGFHLTGGMSGSTDNNISCNNIIANGNYNVSSGGYEWNLQNEQSVNVVVEDNWWGTTDSGIIGASINEDTGIVDYDPPATGSVPCAPIPELGTFLLLSIGLLALAGSVEFARKKE